ncbi:MAG TPA: GNAT family N-acetyltransferase [Bryobacteraceae bacterium]|nr:GNAT family N-acetyltransferase [Bryobacteraceae bacterium]
MPLPLVRTPRLVLQPFAPEDLDALQALWTDPDVRRYLWDDQVVSRSRAAEVLAGALTGAGRHGIGYWTIRQALAGEVIGDVGFQFIPQTADVELMCCLRPQFWSLGLAAEAAGAALEYFWRTTPFPRVFARADLPNQRSIRLMERLAMRHRKTDTALVTYALERPEVG